MIGMSLGTRLKGFFKHGKLQPYDILKQELLGQGDEAQISACLNLLSSEEKEKIVDEVWDKLNPHLQELLALNIYSENWQELTKDFYNLQELEQVRIVEIVGYLATEETIPFLVNQLKSKRESISLTAMTALKRQKAELTLKPMLKALTEPDQWLPARIIEVLRGMKKNELTEELIKLYDNYPQIQPTLIEILGDLGDEQSLPLLEKLIDAPDPALRKKVVEALKNLKLSSSGPLLIKLINDEKWPIRMVAIQTLELLKEERALSYLQERLAIEENPLVKDLLEEAIDKISELEEPQIINWVRQR